MKIEEVLSYLNLEEVDMRLYFVRKSNNMYYSYSPQIENDVKKDLITVIKNYIERYKDCEQYDFSPIGARDSTIEKYETSQLEMYNDIRDSFEKAARESIKDNEIELLSFYCLELNVYINNDEKESIRFYRRITKFKKLSKSGLIGSIKNNRFNRLDNKMIGLDGDVDIIEKDGEMLILNHVSLERIFSIADQYADKAIEAMEKIKSANRIQNFEQFSEDCLNDKRMVRILTKLLSEEDRLDKCFENFENVKKVINMFELEINTTITKKKKEVLVYDDKSQMMDMIRLVRDSFYTSIINERQGYDDAL